MWAPFELRDIQLFLVLCEELSFSRTAERLGITTSRVSQRVAALEARVGGPLFERTSRFVRPTPLGERFRAEIAPAYEGCQRAFALARAQASDAVGSLRIAVHAPMDTGSHLAAAIREFEDLHPGCRVKIVGVDRRDLSALDQDDADVLVVRLPVRRHGLVIGPLLTHEERDVLILARGHPLATRAEVCWDDIAPYAIPVLATYPPEVNDAHYPPTSSGSEIRRVEVQTSAEALILIACGEVVLPSMPSAAAYYNHPDITTVPLLGLGASESALVWLDRGETPLVRRFADAVTAARSGGDGLADERASDDARLT